MGSFRFILSIMVLLSHTGYSPLAGYNIGVIAVASFFLLSGYAMSMMLERYYREPGTVKYFYLDRFWRLFPQYYFYFFLTLLLLGLGWITEEMKSAWLSQVTVVGSLEQLCILPLGYYMFLDFGDGFIAPQTWSLGLEMSFYFLIPWIKRKHMIGPCMLLSGVVFGMAYTGVLHTDWFGYRLLPGTLFIFLTGCLLAEMETRQAKIAVTAVEIICFALLIYTYLDARVRLLYNQSVLLGVVIGIPVIFLLKDKSRNRFDELLGNLSYGIYVNHFFVIYLMSKTPASFAERSICIVLSVLLAYVSYRLVELPSMTRRRVFRKKHVEKGISKQAVIGE